MPIVKDRSDWNLSMEEFIELRFLDAPPGSAGKGNDYQDYLRILFMLMDRVDRNFRIMDVIQWNVQSVQEDFLVKDCISTVEIQTVVEEQHLFLRKGTYSRTTVTSGYY
ncbi:MAG: hypothetical protein IIW68_05480 [Lachnospiraceae bacterium]|nr:hypothetical protein [Lachnospiraceae bacterium]